MASTHRASSGSTGITLTPRRLVGLAIAVLALAFILQNRAAVSTNLLMFEFRAPLWVTLLVVFLAGAAVGWLLQRGRR